jgi:ubiquitin carboxyl-terminal hydrolase 8
MNEMNGPIFKNRKGFTGLANLGNTCFLNSIIQVLVHTPEIINILETIQSISPSSSANINHLLAYECKQLIKMMWERNQIIAPNRFVQVLQIVSAKKGNEIFSGYSQNDVSEFILFIFECIHMAISKPAEVKIKGNVVNQLDEIATKCYEALRDIYAKGYSQIYAHFYGMSYIEILSKEDPNVVLSRKFEQYFLIDLPLPPPEIKTPTIYDCFDCYVAPELLEGDNAWYNEITKEKQDVYKKTSFWSFPPVLVINLKRYKDAVHKDQRQVLCPVDVELVLSKYSISYGSSTYRYKLYAVCNHSGGSILGGHYTSCVNPSDSPGEWFQFNDTLVTPVEVRTVISPQTSCLFYRRCS